MTAVRLRGDCGGASRCEVGRGRREKASHDKWRSGCCQSSADARGELFLSARAGSGSTGLEQSMPSFLWSRVTYFVNKPSATARPFAQLCHHSRGHDGDLVLTRHESMLMFFRSRLSPSQHPRERLLPGEGQRHGPRPARASVFPRRSRGICTEVCNGVASCSSTPLLPADLVPVGVAARGRPV